MIELYVEGKISTRLCNALRRAGIETIGDVVDFLNQGKRLKSIKNLGKKLAKEMLDFLSDTDLLTPQNIFSDYEEKYLLASPASKEYIEKQFLRLRDNKLGNGAKNYLKKYDIGLSLLINLFDKPLDDYCVLFPHKYKGKKAYEIYVFNQEFKGIFETCIGMTDAEMKEAEVKTVYPFLSSDQVYFVVDFISDKGYRPLLFLLYNYLRISENKTDRLYSLFYGISDEGPRTKKELAAAYGVTEERVREILREDIPAVKNLKVTQEEIVRYRKIFSESLFTETSAVVSSLMEMEHLDWGFDVFASLVHLVTGLRIYAPCDTIRILYNKSVIDRNVLFKNFFALRKVAKGSYLKDTDFNLNDMVTCDDTLRPHLVGFLSYAASAEFGLEVDYDGHFTMRQTYIDVETELCEILSCYDVPLHLDELFRCFKQKNPEHKFAEPSQLRPYLLKSKRIDPIGRTSTYALKSRTDIFFGSIRDLIHSFLGSVDVPVHISLLVSMVKATFPKTNQRSIQSSMDNSDDYVKFEGDFYGLTSRTYGRNWKKAQPVHLFSFEERFKNYAIFVEENHRLPSASARNQDEASLGRWKLNFKNSAATATSEQRQRFDGMMRKFSEIGYPTNKPERVFLNYCNEYKRFIQSHHGLPTLEDGKELFEWFRRSLCKYDKYTDQKRNYFSDLLEYISFLGFGKNQGENE